MEKVPYYNIVLVQKFESDMIVKTDSLCEQAHELAELILEVDDYKKECGEAKNNTMAIGISYSDEALAITLLLTEKISAVKRIAAPAKGGIEITGKMLTHQYGIYALRMIYDDKDKDPVLLGPGYIDYHPDTMEFTASFDIDEFLEQPKKMIEFYARDNVESIPYMRKQNREKIRIGQLNFCLKFPCVEFPKENLTEDDKARQALNNKLRLKRLREEEERRAKEDERRRNKENRMRELQMAEQDAEKSEEKSDDEDKSKDDDDASKDYSDQTYQDQTLNDNFASPLKEQQQKQISNTEIREELAVAIDEANQEVEKQIALNDELQERILAMRRDNNQQQEQKSDITMSDIKYANT